MAWPKPERLSVQKEKPENYSVEAVLTYTSVQSKSQREFPDFTPKV